MEDTIITGDEVFQRAFELVIEFEGYKTKDTGGRTVFGISENAHPEAVEKMWNIKKEEALEFARGIYKREYWDLIYDVQWERYLDVDFEMLLIVEFDTAVNLGVERLLRWRDELNQEENWIFIGWRIDLLLMKRLKFYARLAEYSKYRPYFRGWVNRLIKVRDYVEKLKEKEKVDKKEVI